MKRNIWDDWWVAKTHLVYQLSEKGFRLAKFHHLNCFIMQIHILRTCTFIKELQKYMVILPKIIKCRISCWIFIILINIFALLDGTKSITKTPHFEKYNQILPRNMHNSNPFHHQLGRYVFIWNKKTSWYVNFLHDNLLAVRHLNVLSYLHARI